MNGVVVARIDVALEGVDMYLAIPKSICTTIHTPVISMREALGDDRSNGWMRTLGMEWQRMATPQIALLSETSHEYATKGEGDTGHLRDIVLKKGERDGEEHYHPTCQSMWLVAFNMRE